LQGQAEDNKKRKEELGAKIQEKTQQFVDNAATLREELASHKEKLGGLFDNKKKLEEDAEFYFDERGPVGSQKKYQKWIEEDLKIAEDLGKEFDQMHDKMRNFGRELDIARVFGKGKGGQDQVKEIKEQTKVGKLEEKDLKEALMKDLDEKQKEINDGLRAKEDMEEQMVSYATVSQIYVRSLLIPYFRKHLSRHKRNLNRTLGSTGGKGIRLINTWKQLEAISMITG